MTDLMVATVSVDVKKFDRILRASPDIESKRLELLAYWAEAPNSVAKDLNYLLERSCAQSRYIALVHDDVYLPQGWADRVMKQIALVEAKDPDWGVLGVAGARWDKALGKKFYEGDLMDRKYPYYTSHSPLPCEVDTLDEVCLILRNDGETRLNERYPSYHLYGAELCLRLARAGHRNYAIDAYLEHRGTNDRDHVPSEFYFNAGLLWMEYGERMQPIATNCMTLRKENGIVVMDR